LGVGDSDIYVYDQIIITWFQSSVDKQARDWAELWDEINWVI
jgi:hypothetical protein